MIGAEGCSMMLQAGGVCSNSAAGGREGRGVTQITGAGGWCEILEKGQKALMWNTLWKLIFGPRDPQAQRNRLLRRLTSQLHTLENLMTEALETQAVAAQELEDVAEVLIKIGTETGFLLKRVQELLDAEQAQNQTVTQRLHDAIVAVTNQAKAVDTLVPDLSPVEPAPAVAVAPSTAPAVPVPSEPTPAEPTPSQPETTPAS